LNSAIMSLLKLNLYA